MALANQQNQENELYRRDLRTRARPTMLKVNGPAPTDHLTDLADTVVAFSTPQPALGVATTIPGCNCQTCRQLQPKV